MTAPDEPLGLYLNPADIGRDGYPLAWNAIKNQVREEAGHRCVRCGHPYQVGQHGTGEWSPCDQSCLHRGLVRILEEDEWVLWPEEATWMDGANVGGLFPRTPLGGHDLGEIEARWRILTVHHLNGIKADCRWWNLVALCQRCHLSVQSRVRMAQVWPWEHTEWFQPYVAGFYAWEHLGQELSRSEVEARLVELLDLERTA